MSTAGIVQHRPALRPCCPACRSLSLTQFKRTWGCNSCKASFVTPDFREALTHKRAAKDAPPPKPKAQGSGVFGEPVRERPMRPLEYDMMSHARLCMATRR